MSSELEKPQKRRENILRDKQTTSKTLLMFLDVKEPEEKVTILILDSLIKISSKQSQKWLER